MCTCRCTWSGIKAIILIQHSHVLFTVPQWLLTHDTMLPKYTERLLIIYKIRGFSAAQHSL